MRKLYLLCVFLLFVVQAMAQTIAPTNNILYVNINVAGGNGSGDSWENAVPELADALKWANDYKTSGLWSEAEPLQIWVAKGTYKPKYTPEDEKNFSATPTDPRDKSFLIVENVELYGGFAGTETTLAGRDLNLTTNASILSGDIGTPNDETDNAYHVVVSAGAVGNALLNGFSITAGYASGGSGSITVNSNTVYRVYGGGMYNRSSSLTLTHVAIYNNTASSYGGGMYNYSSNPTLTQVAIYNNTVSPSSSCSGGGMYNGNSSPSLTHVAIYNNTASSSSYAYGGGMYNHDSSKPILTQVTLAFNQAKGSKAVKSKGGGIRNGNSSAPEIYNSIIWGNTGFNDVENNINNFSSSPEFYHSLVQGSGGSTSWDTTFGTNGTGNIDADPLFTDVANKDFSLQSNSPAIDAGKNSYYTDADKGNGNLTTDKDLAGNPRLFGTIIDMGAYENQGVQYTPDVNNILYVNQSVDQTVAGYTGTGDSWANAVPELADALKWAKQNETQWANTTLQIWVAGGTYKPMYSPADNNFGDNANRDNTFLMVNNVQLYGGFAGTETTLAGRDLNLTTNASILSGDIGTPNDETDNAYHVVVSAGVVGNALLNGFSITAGYASGSGNITVNSKIIYPNRGGGMYNSNSHPTLTHVAIYNNTASSSSSSSYGGGMYNIKSNPTLTQVAIYNNTASSSSYQAYGGGMYNTSSSPTLIQVTLAFNQAKGSSAGNSRGGGIRNDISSPKIYNSIIWGNTGFNNEVNNIVNASISPKFYHSLVQGSGGSASWDTTFGINGAGNIDADPLFTDVANKDFSLQSSSPAINAGKNSYYTDADKGNGNLTTDKDLAGKPRLFGTTIDMGAYENQGVQYTPDAANILYVNQSVDQTVAGYTGLGDSWANAVPELADALKWANANKNQWANTTLQIWVAGGTYKPMYSPADNNFGNNANRNNAFLMVNNVQLYGGFAGTETTLAGRDLNLTTNASILSGDIGTPNVETDNAYHVVVSAGAVGNALLNGFSITAGYASGSGAITVNSNTVHRVYGGGMYNRSSSLTLTHVAIYNNTASSYGGGMYNSNSHPTLTHVAIYNNTASSSSSSSYGGGMYNTKSNPTLTQVAIYNNTASSSSYQAYGGGMYNTSSSPTLIQVTLAFNQAKGSSAGNSRGGGIRNGISSAPEIYNSIIWGNTGFNDVENNINNFSSSPEFYHSLVQGSGGSTSWDTTFGTNGTGNIDADPLFTDVANKDFSLQSSSPAINAGKNSYYTDTDKGNGNLTTDKDLAGKPRLASCAIDIGAYEKQGILNTPAPTANDQEFCIAADATIADLVVTGTAVKWYADATSTTALSSTDLLVDGTTYYATQTLNNCESINRTAVTVTIHNTPAPTANDQEFCIAADATIADLVVTGTAVKWYNSATSTTALSSTDLLVDGTTYYATQTLNNCESVVRTPVTVTIHNTPAPTANDQEFCIAADATITDLVVTGTAVKWYADATSTTALSSTTLLVDGTAYYATQTLNNCESIDRTAVTVTIHNTPAPTANHQEFCIAADATIADLVVTGTAVKWYADATSTTALSSTDLLVDGTTYYATQTLNNCESIDRTAVTVTIHNTPAPTANDQAFCIAENATIADLVAIGTDIKWYESATSTTALSSTDLLVDGTSYFASQTLNNCESVSRKEVQVTINDTTAPTAVDQAFCIAENATIADLVAIGTDIKWYESATSTTALSSTDLLVDGTTYYATQTLNNCESVERTAVIVTIEEPAAPTVTSTISYFYGDIPQALTATADFNHSLLWYTVEQGGIGATTVPVPSTTSVGVQEYWVSQITSHGCESDRAKITVTITKAMLTVTADDNQTKVYGEVDPVFEYTVTGYKNNDTGTVLPGALSRVAGEDVGTYAITKGNLSGGANYDITFVSKDFTITKAMLTVTTDANQTKTYGDTDPILTYDVTGLKNGDIAATVLSGQLERIAGEGVGTYAITKGTLDVNGNYNLTFVSKDFTITKAMLTVTADDNQTKVYGEVDPVLTYTTTGFKNNDTAAVLSGQLERIAGEDVGTYAITKGTLDVNGNYDITFVSKDFTITKAMLTVTADDNQTKTYGDTDPILTYDVTGLKNGDIAATVLSGQLERIAGEGVGTYAITKGTLDVNGNYNLTFVSKDFTITKAMLTVTADDNQTKTYGDTDPILTYDVTGLKNGDIAAIVLSGQLERIAGEGVGTYAITKGTLDVNGNYNLTFVSKDFTITKAMLTITADDNQTKTYGDADPVLTYTVTGYQNEDTAAVLTGALTRAIGEDVGTYAINQGTLVADTNYDITFVSKDFTITKAMLTVTADDNQTKTYGDTDPILTYNVTGLKNGDIAAIVLSGQLERIAGEGVGTYAITQGTLDVNGNYNLTFVSKDFTITKAMLTVTTDANQTKVYGDTDPILTYDVTGLKNGDTETVLSGALDRVAGENVGVYAIQQGTLVTNENYIITFVGADFTITKATIQGVTLNAATFGYDGTPKSLAIVGTLPAGASVSYQNNSHTNLGVYSVVANIDGGVNYFNLTLTADLTIEKGTITSVYFPSGTFTYDGTPKSLGISGSLPAGTSVSYVNNDQTNAGTYTVTAHVDGGGNYNDLNLQALLTIKKAPITGISFSNATFVYDGTVKSIAVQGTLPVGATVSYQNNYKIDAGVYTVTANISGGVNYTNLTLTGRLTIEKAPQTIDFTLVSPVVLEEVQDHQLNGTASSGLSVSYSYTYDSATPAATVSDSGWLTFKHTGSIEITAHQEGNNNYHSASSVTKTLVVESKDASIHELWIDEEYFEKPTSEITYSMDCEDLRDEVRVRIATQLGAQVDPAHEFVIAVPTPGTHSKVIRITSQNGKEVQEYTIRIEKPFLFSYIAQQKYDNVLLINNNPKTNGGYRFVKFEWYKNGELIGTEQVYSAGKRATDLLDETAVYHAILTTDTGDVIQVCPTDIRLLHQYNVKLYPSPAQAGKSVTVKITYPLEQIRGERLYIYDLNGRRIATTIITAEDTELVLPSGIQTGTYMATFSMNGQHKVIHFVVE